jgi:starch synthase (maltosyl-transferring)
VARFSVEAGLPAERLVVIPNGVDLDQHSAAKPESLDALGIAPGRRLVTFIGRLEPQKGLPWLLATAAEWLPRLPGCDLVLVGRGPDRPALEQLVMDRGIASRVHFLGWRPDVPRILAASELLVLSSRWEGMPNVVLQAMAGGLPVLATDVEGVREILGEDADAQTVAYGDTPSFVENVVRLLGDRELAERLGRENRRRIERTFSIQRTVAAYQDLWASIVERSV